MLRYDIYQVTLHFLNVCSTTSLRLCFVPDLGQKEKYIILQALQTGESVSCLG